MASNRSSKRGDAAQVPTDGHRTGQAPATMTRIHAFPGSDLPVLLPQYLEEPPYPLGHPPPSWERNCLTTHHLGRHLPIIDDIPPPSLGCCGTARLTVISKRTRGPKMRRPQGTTSPPSTERWSPDWLARSKRPPTPTTPLNYTNTRHRHSRRHCKESDAHPPPLGTQHTRTTCRIVFHT